MIPSWRIPSQPKEGPLYNHYAHLFSQHLHYFFYRFKPLEKLRSLYQFEKVFWVSKYYSMSSELSRANWTECFHHPCSSQRLLASLQRQMNSPCAWCCLFITFRSRFFLRYSFLQMICLPSSRGLLCLILCFLTFNFLNSTVFFSCLKSSCLYWN